MINQGVINQVHFQILTMSIVFSIKEKHKSW